MFDTSPIESWEGAAAIFTYANGGAVICFIIVAILCLVPIIVALKAEQSAEISYAAPVRLQTNGTDVAIV